MLTDRSLWDRARLRARTDRTCPVSCRSDESGVEQQMTDTYNKSPHLDHNLHLVASRSVMIQTFSRFIVSSYSCPAVRITRKWTNLDIKTKARACSRGILISFRVCIDSVKFHKFRRPNFKQWNITHRGGPDILIGIRPAALNSATDCILEWNCFPNVQNALIISTKKVVWLVCLFVCRSDSLCVGKIMQKKISNLTFPHNISRHVMRIFKLETELYLNVYEVFHLIERWALGLYGVFFWLYKWISSLLVCWGLRAKTTGLIYMDPGGRGPKKNPLHCGLWSGWQSRSSMNQ